MGRPCGVAMLIPCFTPEISQLPWLPGEAADAVRYESRMLMSVAFLLSQPWLPVRNPAAHGHRRSHIPTGFAAPG